MHSTRSDCLKDFIQLLYMQMWLDQLSTYVFVHKSTYSSFVFSLRNKSHDVNKYMEKICWKATVAYVSVEFNKRQISVEIDIWQTQNIQPFVCEKRVHIRISILFK